MNTKNNIPYIIETLELALKNVNVTDDQFVNFDFDGYKLKINNNKEALQKAIKDLKKLHKNEYLYTNKIKDAKKPLKVTKIKTAKVALKTLEDALNDFHLDAGILFYVELIGDLLQNDEFNNFKTFCDLAGVKPLFVKNGNGKVNFVINYKEIEKDFYLIKNDINVVAKGAARYTVLHKPTALTIGGNARNAKDAIAYFEKVREKAFEQIENFDKFNYTFVEKRLGF